MPPVSIFNMFGRSPIRPLQEHMDKVVAASVALVPFFDAVQSGNWQQAECEQANIANLENEADKVKDDIRQHLHKGLFLPVPRGDLVEIIVIQDRIANIAKDISGLVLGRKMQLPKEVETPFFAFLERCIDASKQAEKAISQLDELLVTGFSGNEVEVVQAMVNELHAIEYDTDEIQIGVRRQLFAIEKTLPPVDVMFLYKIIEWTGGLADCAEKVGTQLQLMLAR